MRGADRTGGLSIRMKSNRSRSSLSKWVRRSECSSAETLLWRGPLGRMDTPGTDVSTIASITSASSRGVRDISNVVRPVPFDTLKIS